MWVAVDDKKGGIVGAAAAFPRRMYFGGKERHGFVLGDFCMDEGYRTLGPSVQMQRVCMDAIKEGPQDFLYDFPSAAMTAVYSRLGIRARFQLVRWAKPVRAEKKIELLAKSKLAAQVLSPVVDLALMRRGWKGNASSCRLELLQGLCGEEFTELDASVRPTSGISTVRTAAFLNWRYRLKSSEHNLLTARQSGKLVGYIVFRADKDDACIMDLSCKEASTAARLLNGAVRRLYELGASTVSLYAGNTHPWSQVFIRVGFRQREAVPVVFHSRSDNSGPSADSQDPWFVMRGERDS